MRILLSVTCVLAAGNLYAANSPENPPNIIYILADDMGYGDLGCYGSKVNTTPNIDTLAANGIRFTEFHAASWCAPSRRALMTGWHSNRPGPIGQRITIAEMLKERGYATALLGKWHLGMDEGTHPLDQGFDYYYGTRGSNDWNGPAVNYPVLKSAPESAWKTPLLRNRDVLEKACPQSSFTRKYTQEAIRLINENKDRPFFIYLAHNMPHVAVFTSEPFKGKSKNGVYGDVLLELDWSTGEIVKALEEAGISDNTQVVFTSDNGPWSMFREFGGVADPLRGEKSTTWNGGGQVPCIYTWPGRIKPAVSPAFIVNHDVYATLAKITGSPIKDGEAIDSLDMSGSVRRRTEPENEAYLLFSSTDGLAQWRLQDSLLHAQTYPRSRDWSKRAVHSSEPTVAL
ncbi:MAG: sulfatase-like hydrolase/transferase [Candidatus Hydrogenedentes bacterium]|jgi:arylsulfatase A-like enzyme|nr:sulfatase-like hydrolase/transferase [Candidatus Hydrogenedentota bacterium]